MTLQAKKLVPGFTPASVRRVPVPAPPPVTADVTPSERADLQSEERVLEAPAGMWGY